jgi:hypothetical protein
MNSPEILSAPQIEPMLLRGPVESQRGREAFDRAPDKVLPLKQAKATLPPKSDEEDRPDFWHKGEPMPDWMRDALLDLPDELET